MNTKLSMDTGKFGGGTHQSISWVALPAYNRKKSRKPIADPYSQLRMNNTIKANARGRWWIWVGTVNVGSMEKRSGEVSDVVQKESRCVWFARGEI